MNTKLKNQLYKEYPKILKDTEINVENGWYTLIDELCNYINIRLETRKNQSLVITKIKQKFGGLRISTFNLNIDENVKGAIDLTMFLSYRVCENCGLMSNVETGADKEGYIKSLCKNCKKL